MKHLKYFCNTSYTCRRYNSTKTMERIIHPLNNGERIMMIPVPLSAFEFEIKYPKSMSPLLLYCLFNPTGSGAGSQCLPEQKGGYNLLGCYLPSSKEIDFAEKVKPEWFSNKELGISVPRRIVDFTLPHVKQIIIDYFISLLQSLTEKQWPMKLNPISSSAPTTIDFDNGDLSFREDDYLKAYKEWSEAESKVMPDKFVVILIK